MVSLPPKRRTPSPQPARDAVGARTPGGRARTHGGRLRAPALIVTALLTLAGCVVTPESFRAHSGGRSLTVWSYLTETETDHSLSTVDALFERKYPGVRIRHVTVPLNEFGPKLLAAAGTGKGPDVIVGNPVADFNLLSSAHVYADLGPYWKRYADARHFPREALWRDRHRQLRAVHWRFNDLGLWYNKDILRRYGIAPPKTTAELERAMAAVTRKGPYKGITFSGDPSVQTAWQTMSWLYGEGAGYCSTGSAGARRALSMVGRWKNRGYLPGDASALDQEDAFGQFLTGRYAFAVGGSWEVGRAKAEAPGFRYGTSRIPAGRHGSHVAFAGESVGIGAFSKHKDLAWRYLRTSFLEPKAQLATFGASGALPTREDARRAPAVTRPRLNRPFLRALAPGELADWPDNPNTLDAQTNFGTLVSSMIAGEYSAGEAADRSASRIDEDFKGGGGGGC